MDLYAQHVMVLSEKYQKNSEESHVTRSGTQPHSYQSVCPSLHERSILADYMICQRGCYWCTCPETSHSQISQPNVGSPCPFFPFHPLSHSLQVATLLRITTHTVSLCCDPHEHVMYGKWNTPLSFPVLDDPISTDLLWYTSSRCGE